VAELTATTRFRNFFLDKQKEGETTHTQKKIWKCFGKTLSDI